MANADDAELGFGRACALEALGRIDEAKQAYLAVLQADPSHFGAINNLGTMLFAIALYRDAAVLYAEAVKRHPRNVTGYVNLAGAYFELGEYEAAKEAYEAALVIEPGRQAAHQGLGNALSRLGEDAAAATHFARAFQGRAIVEETHAGPARSIRVLTLFDASIGNIVTRPFFDTATMHETKIAAAFFDPAHPLPPHDLIFNAIGDADRCAPALDRAAGIVARSAAPVVNHPGRVGATGRTAIARYRAVENVVTPKTALVARAALYGDRNDLVVEREGLSFPLLLRAPGYHAGEHFEKAENAAQLANAAQRLPGDRALLIEYLDARDADGAYRKYRVIVVDNRLFPLHLAISDTWKVHYFSAAMAKRGDRRRADAAFLNDMPAAIGPAAMRALEGIAAKLELDFAGIDFGIDREGRLLLFEANATMAVPSPEPGARWEYRRPHVARILEAMRMLIPSRIEEARRRPQPS